MTMFGSHADDARGTIRKLGSPLVASACALGAPRENAEKLTTPQLAVEERGRRESSVGKRLPLRCCARRPVGPPPESSILAAPGLVR